MRWFGPNWGAPVCDDEGEKIPTPTDARCGFCGKQIVDGDQGLVLVGVWSPEGWPVHLDCLLESVSGPREG